MRRIDSHCLSRRDWIHRRCCYTPIRRLDNFPHLCELQFNNLFRVNRQVAALPKRSSFKASHLLPMEYATFAKLAHQATGTCVANWWCAVLSCVPSFSITSRGWATTTQIFASEQIANTRDCGYNFKVMRHRKLWSVILTHSCRRWVAISQRCHLVNSPPTKSEYWPREHTSMQTFCGKPNISGNLSHRTRFALTDVSPYAAFLLTPHLDIHPSGAVDNRILRTVTFEQLRNFFERNVDPASSQRRKISIHVRATTSRQGGAERWITHIEWHWYST